MYENGQGVARDRREAIKWFKLAAEENWFLVGLSRSEADRDRNVDLLNKNAWIDVQILLANKKLAKITFEKGPPGERAIADAYSEWRFHP
jgi:TPR repeat protein